MRHLDADQGLEFADGQLRIGQDLEDADAGRVRERPEELGFELRDGARQLGFGAMVHDGPTGLQIDEVVR
jgi:hypothetical protein